ncbi:hypothetical protein EJB05_10372, partial [Eragrostis curvula]
MTRKQPARAASAGAGPALKRGPWSLIAGRLPGRTDNEIKNYWNSHLSRKLVAQGIDPRTHRPLNGASPHDTPNSNAAAAASANNKKNPPVVELPSASPLGPPSSSSGAGVVGDDFAELVGLGGADDGFEGFGDQLFRVWDAPRGGIIDFACPVVDDDGTFSSFLDSLINEDQFVGYFGGHNNADGDNKDHGGVR